MLINFIYNFVIFSFWHFMWRLGFSKIKKVAFAKKLLATDSSWRNSVKQLPCKACKILGSLFLICNVKCIGLTKFFHLYAFKHVDSVIHPRGCLCCFPPLSISTESIFVIMLHIFPIASNHFHLILKFKKLLSISRQ